MLKLGEIFLVLIEGAVADREAMLDIDNRVSHWRSMEVASHCSASRECMLIAYLNDDCMAKAG